MLCYGNHSPGSQKAEKEACLIDCLQAVAVNCRLSKWLERIGIGSDKYVKPLPPGSTSRIRTARLFNHTWAATWDKALRSQTETI